MSIRIKRLQKEDAGILFSLNSIFYPGNKTSHERCEEMLGDPESIYIAAFYDNVPVGWVIGYILHRFLGDKMFLYEIDVDENYRRKGIAFQLINALKKYAQERECFDMFVLTNVDNPPARALYEKTGGVTDFDNGVQISWKFTD